MDDDGDGLNALVSVASYRYDAQGRRVEYIDQTRNVTVRYAYDGANAIVACEYDSSSLTGTRSYVHGTQYIDERAVMRDHAQDPVAGDNEVGQDHYYLLKDLYTVAGLVGCNGGPEEYYVYDTYGNVTMYAWPVGTSASWESTSDLDRSGGVDIADQSIIKSAVQNSNPNPFFDVDFSGTLNIIDQSVVSGASQAGLTAVVVNYSTVDNPYFFTGRLTDTLHADDLVAANDPDGVKRLQDNRNRMYDPKHGRWLQRDPIGYVDGMDLYQYVTGRPTMLIDPHGKFISPTSMAMLIQLLTMPTKQITLLMWWGQKCEDNLSQADLKEFIEWTEAQLRDRGESGLTYSETATILGGISGEDRDTAFNLWVIETRVNPFLSEQHAKQLIEMNAINVANIEAKAQATKIGYGDGVVIRWKQTNDKLLAWITGAAVVGSAGVNYPPFYPVSKKIVMPNQKPTQAWGQRLLFQWRQQGRNVPGFVKRYFGVRGKWPGTFIGRTAKGSAWAIVAAEAIILGEAMYHSLDEENRKALLFPEDWESLKSLNSP